MRRVATLATCICRDPECSVPYGLCHCGCRRQTNIATRSDAKTGVVIGMPLQFFGRHRRYISVRDARPEIRQPDDPFIRYIPLTQGQYAVVDTHLYEWLMEWNWQAHFNKHTNSYYAVRLSREGGTSRGHILMHRQIAGLGPGRLPMVDHKNHDTLDNRGSNLRITDGIGNAANSRKKPGRYLKGTFPNSAGRFKAQIQYQGVLMALGTYDTEVEAHAVYQEAAKKYFGEFALVNS